MLNNIPHIVKCNICPERRGRCSIKVVLKDLCHCCPVIFWCGLGAERPAVTLIKMFSSS